MQEKIKISVITPFYYGNGYMRRLLYSIRMCAEKNRDAAFFEVLIVNDSPDEQVCIPKEFEDMNIKVTCNEQNMGIQRTRINGLRQATGNWILFLDQDDELICDGFARQILLTEESDVIIGNGLYQFGTVNRKIFHTKNEMTYLMQLRRFIQIRNMIPSPGECLIRKDIIPNIWINEPLMKNGADDWLLWILLFKSGVRMECNPEVVYIHNDTDGKNLSSDLKKMKDSANEMYKLLKKNNCLTDKEKKELSNAIAFKYLQDSGKLKMRDLRKYYRTIFANIGYKFSVTLSRRQG